MIKIKLEKLLKEHKMTKMELAEMTNIRPSTICDMCNGNSRSLKINNIDKICSVLDCKISDFIVFISS